MINITRLIHLLWSPCAPSNRIWSIAAVCSISSPETCRLPARYRCMILAPGFATKLLLIGCVPQRQSSLPVSVNLSKKWFVEPVGDLASISDVCNVAAGWCSWLSLAELARQDNYYWVSGIRTSLYVTTWYDKTQKYDNISILGNTRSSREASQKQLL